MHPEGRNGEEDPAYGGTPVDTWYTARLAPIAYDAEGLDGAVILSGDVQIYVSSAGLAIVPSPGVKVRGIKTGPDYIDPGFHAFATGTPGLNLDSWAMRPELLRHLFLQQTDGAWKRTVVRQISKSPMRIGPH